MIVGLMMVAALASPAQPQARVVTGTVSDVSGMALAGAEVDVVCGGRRGSTITDAAGRFSIDGVPVERCAVVAALEGFYPSRQVVDLRSQDAQVDLRLGVRQFSSQVLVTPGRGAEEESARIPQGTSVVNRDQLDARPFTVVTQAFKEEPGVLAQQTTSSQGSPILRGLTGQRNLYLLDGIRYNTAAWRDGPSQYLAWLPSAGLDRAEIVRGPGSALYGSDAMGGAFALFSAMPREGKPPRVAATGGLDLGGANGLRGANGMFGVEHPGISLQVGASAASASDLRPGGEVDSHAAVTRFLGLPSSTIGPELEQTGFDQSSAFVVVRAPLGGGRTLSGSYRHATQSGAHRYDQELGGNGRYLSAFDPQALDFGYVRVTVPTTAWVDTLSASVSMNRQADGRVEQARPTARVDAQSNTTTAIGYQVQAARAFSPRAEATFGADVYDEYISGERTLTEPSGTVSRARPDIPDGTRYTSFGAYWQQTADLVPGRLSMRGGLRFGRFAFSSTEDPTLGVPDEHIVTTDTTFNVAAVVVLSSSVNATMSVSRGFRAANAFDFGGIGLSGGAGFEIAPSRAVSLDGIRGTTDGATAVTTGQAIGALGPEALVAYEAGLRWQSGRVSGSATVFDLELHDQIERRTVIFPGNVVGEDIAGYVIIRQDTAGRAYVAGEARPIVSRVNVSRGRIVGFEAHTDVRVATAITARGWASAARGMDLASGAPLRRMPPVLGGASVRWQAAGRRWWVEGTLLAAAAQDRLSDGDLGDARIGANRTPASIAAFFNGTATDRGLVQNGLLVATGETLAQVQARVLGGATLLPLYTETAGFAALGLRAGLAVGAHADVTLIAENLTDRNYRLHGSGVDEPGVNAALRLRLKF